jgi:hypothetical protein
MSWCSIEPCDPQTGHLTIGGAVVTIGEPVPFFTEVLVRRERMSRTTSAMRLGVLSHAQISGFGRWHALFEGIIGVSLASRLSRSRHATT